MDGKRNGIRELREGGDHEAHAMQQIFPKLEEV